MTGGILVRAKSAIIRAIFAPAIMIAIFSAKPTTPGAAQLFPLFAQRQVVFGLAQLHSPLKQVQVGSQLFPVKRLGDVPNNPLKNAIFFNVKRPFVTPHIADSDFITSFICPYDQPRQGQGEFLLPAAQRSASFVWF